MQLNTKLYPLDSIYLRALSLSLSRLPSPSLTVSFSVLSSLFGWIAESLKIPLNSWKYSDNHCIKIQNHIRYWTPYIFARSLYRLPSLSLTVNFSFLSSLLVELQNPNKNIGKIAKNVHIFRIRLYWSKTCNIMISLERMSYFQELLWFKE